MPALHVELIQSVLDRRSSSTPRRSGWRTTPPRTPSGRATLRRRSRAMATLATQTSSAPLRPDGAGLPRFGHSRGLCPAMDRRARAARGDDAPLARRSGHQGSLTLYRVAGGQGGGGVVCTAQGHLEPSQKNSPGLTSPPQAPTPTQPGSGCPCWGTDTHFYQNRKSAYQKHKTLHMENNISVYPLQGRHI